MMKLPSSAPASCRRGALQVSATPRPRRLPLEACGPAGRAAGFEARSSFDRFGARRVERRAPRGPGARRWMAPGEWRCRRGACGGAGKGWLPVPTGGHQRRQCARDRPKDAGPGGQSHRDAPDTRPPHAQPRRARSHRHRAGAARSDCSLVEPASEVTPSTRSLRQPPGVQPAAPWSPAGPGVHRPIASG